MYLKILEMMHMFEQIQNIMNHMDEYQALFQMFENSTPGKSSENFSNLPFGAMSSLFNGNMPDFNSIQKMMEGSDLVDEFTYMEGSSCTEEYGSQKNFSSDKGF